MRHIFVGYIIHNVEKGVCKLKLDNVTWAVLLIIYFSMTSLTIICYIKIYIKHARWYIMINIIISWNISLLFRASEALRKSGRDQNQHRLLKMLVVTSVAFAVCFLIPLVFGLISKFIQERPRMPGLIKTSQTALNFRAIKLYFQWSIFCSKLCLQWA